MELVEGRDLSEVIHGTSRPATGTSTTGTGATALQVSDPLAIARQIALALEAAHEKGIIHRDLKPANVKVRDDGTVKVLDFGLAKAMDPAVGGGSTAPGSESRTMTSPALTEMGLVLGTAAYMSPEQARGRAVDRRADIWAFGVVMYEVLTGQRLFGGDTVSDTIAAVLTKEPDLSLVPPAWRRLLGKCLEKDVRSRLRDIGDAWLLFDEAPAAAATDGRREARSMAPWLIVALAAGSLVTFAVTSFRSGSAVPEPVAFLESPPTGTQFVEAPVPSPDGRHLAMLVRDAAGDTSVWVRTLAAEAARALDGTEGATVLFWSPDSEQLAFHATGQVRRIPRDGGPASLVATVPDVSGGAWTADGDIIVSTRTQGLARVPAEGGTLRHIPVTLVTDTPLVRDVDLTPDGRHVIFTQFGGETGLYASALDGSGLVLLIPGEESRARIVGDVIVREDGGMLVGQRFTPSDMSLVGEPFPIAQDVGGRAFAGGPAGVLAYVRGAGIAERLTWFARTGEEMGAAGPEGQFREVHLSLNGRWLVFVQQDLSLATADIWAQDLLGGPPNRLTSDPGIDHLVAISHDEREIAWEAHAGGALNLMRRPTDGSAGPRLVRQWSRAGGPTGWSPDGHFLAYGSDDGVTKRNMWLVPMNGSGDPFTLIDSKFDDTDARFSPDGRWLAYVSNASGQNEVHLQRLDGVQLVGGPQRLSDGGGEQPLWRRDSAELFFLRDGTVMAAEIRSTGDGAAGTPQAVFAIPGFRPEEHNYAVTPDGQRFIAIVPVIDRTPRPATVLLDWQPAVRR